LSVKADGLYRDPWVRAVSRGRWRIIQAAERARQAIAHSAIGCAVISGVMAAPRTRADGSERRRPTNYAPLTRTVAILAAHTRLLTKLSNPM
jgi:hypothetical protein